jgi:hypothetical protein
MEKAVKRLVEDWDKYGKIIVAVDYDDTISPWRLVTTEDIEATGIIKTLKKAQSVGCYLVCFTACSPTRYSEIQSTFDSLGLRLDSINRNPVEDLPYGNDPGSKILYNLLLDDRAGLHEALEILNKAMYIHLGNIKTRDYTNLDDVA